MNNYKESFEYAFDLLEHYYNQFENLILSTGKDNLKIVIPYGIFALLKSYTDDNKVTFPTEFRGIQLQVYDGKSIMFAFKEVRR